MKIVIKKLVVHNHPAEPKKAELHVGNLASKSKIDEVTEPKKSFSKNFHEEFVKYLENCSIDDLIIGKSPTVSKWPGFMPISPIVPFPDFLLRKLEENQKHYHSKKMIECFFKLNKGKRKMTRGFTKKSFHQLKELGLQCDYRYFLDELYHLECQYNFQIEKQSKK